MDAGGIAAAVEGLLDDVAWLDDRQLAVRLQELERIARTVEAAKAAVVSVADRTDAFRVDGHLTVRAWVQASVRVPRRHALDLTRLARVCAGLPVVFEHLAAGTLGVAQAAELAKVYANPRIGDQLADVIDAFVVVAERAPWHRFVDELRTWEQLTDADGAHGDSESTHLRRGAQLTDVDGVTALDVHVGAVQGQVLTEVLEHFEQAEFEAEWAGLKARLGDDAAPDLLTRTPAQRRADAVVAIFTRAAAADPGAKGPEPVVNLVTSDAVFAEELTALVEGRIPDFDTIDPNRLWSTTTTGTWVDPLQVVAAALVGHVRRVVVDGEGRIIDFGRRKRLFTGAAREAAVIQAVLDRIGGRCLWPGCGRRRTQLDHNQEWHRDHGDTDLRNSGPFCGCHNLLKTTGYRTWRDATGIWHLQRPDGTEIQAA